MSFILDALKKSENDRQRQSGPALFEVRVAPPRSRFPPWAIAVAALLVINLSVIGWLMLRKPAAAASPSAEAANVPAVPAQSAPTPIAAPASAPISGQAPPVAATQNPQGSPPALAQNLAPGQSATQAPYEPPPLTAGPQGAVDPSATTGAGNPDDYAPATDPSTSGPFGGHVRRGTESGLPTYAEAATKDSLPPLRLDLHVYAPDPRKRFVLVNMKRLYEGDSLPEGVKVESITTEGAIVSYRGSKFILERE